MELEDTPETNPENQQEICFFFFTYLANTRIWTNIHSLVALLKNTIFERGTISG